MSVRTSEQPLSTAVVIVRDEWSGPTAVAGQHSPLLPCAPGTPTVLYMQDQYVRYYGARETPQALGRQHAWTSGLHQMQGCRPPRAPPSHMHFEIAVNDVDLRPDGDQKKGAQF